MKIFFENLPNVDSLLFSAYLFHNKSTVSITWLRLSFIVFKVWNLAEIIANNDNIDYDSK